MQQILISLMSSERNLKRLPVLLTVDQVVVSLGGDDFLHLFEPRQCFSGTSPNQVRDYARPGAPARRGNGHLKYEWCAAVCYPLSSSSDILWLSE